MTGTQWVVYQTPLAGRSGGLNAVCEQSEWDAMQAARPGYHTLVMSGIRTEGEAERLARGTSGDPVPRAGRVLFGAPVREKHPVSAPTGPAGK